MKKIEDVIRTAFMLPEGTEVRNDMGPGRLEGWDSLGHVKLMATLESTYSVTIDMGEMIGIESVTDIRTLLNAKGVVEC